MCVKLANNRTHPKGAILGKVGLYYLSHYRGDFLHIFIAQYLISYVYDMNT